MKQRGRGVACGWYGIARTAAMDRADGGTGAGIAGGGDHHDALGGQRGDPAFNQGILRTGEAHIDDLCAVRRCVIQSLQDHERRAFRAA